MRHLLRTIALHYQSVLARRRRLFLRFKAEGALMARFWQDLIWAVDGCLLAFCEQYHFAI
jgi:hypothetical protein